jgi:hypothetical protein
MTKNKFKQDKGQAGLTIFLSLIVMLFVIGLLVMIFSLMGGELQNASYDTLTAGTVINDSNAKPTTAGITLSKSLLRDGACGTVTAIYNGTGGISIALANISQTGCVVKNTSTTTMFGATWLYSYPYTYSADNVATDVMNNTVEGISEATDWFAIFIVIGAMVVLILLTVVIITAIRGSGITMQSNSGNKIGTA